MVAGLKCNDKVQDGKWERRKDRAVYILILWNGGLRNTVEG